jgi:hypothetical protein
MCIKIVSSQWHIRKSRSALITQGVAFIIEIDVLND